MKNHPLPNFNFQVEWGATRIGFQEVTGLDFETEVIEYREGSSIEASPLKLPGLNKYGDITLKRGIVSSDNEIYEWFSDNKMGSTQPRDVTIRLLDEERQPVVVWKVVRAWIKKMSGPTLDAQASSVAIEEMTLTCEKITVENG